MQSSESARSSFHKSFKTRSTVAASEEPPPMPAADRKVLLQREVAALRASRSPFQQPRSANAQVVLAEVAREPDLAVLAQPRCRRGRRDRSGGTPSAARGSRQALAPAEHVQEQIQLARRGIPPHRRFIATGRDREAQLDARVGEPQRARARCSSYSWYSIFQPRSFERAQPALLVIVRLCAGLVRRPAANPVREPRQRQAKTSTSLGQRLGIARRGIRAARRWSAPPLAFAHDARHTLRRAAW